MQTQVEQVDFAAMEVGEELPPISHGPLRLDHFVKYIFAGGVPAGREEFKGNVHYDPWAAARAGFNDVFDMGAWRTALFIQVAENLWAGPHARVTRIRNRYGGMVYRDDTIRFCARLTGKRVIEAGGLEVDLEVWNDVGGGPRATVGELTLRIPGAP